MVEQLFGSKTRVKLLKLFYSNPNRSFYVREITRKIDEQINSVRRELANLLSIGIISSDNTNNRLYYEVDQKYEYYVPLEQIFGLGTTKVVASKKTAATKEEDAPSAPVKESKAAAGFKQLGNVELALYTGQFTRDERAGIDLLIVGDINQTQLGKFIEDLEKKEGKEIRYAVLSLEEYKYRRQIKDRFISQVETAKKQILVDKHQLLTADKE